MRVIPFSPPDITQVEVDAVVETLKSGWITTGPKTKQFESEIASYCGTKRAVCLNSATAGLELTLRLLGIGEGDEVITTAYTYTASASVIAHVGAKIVMVDVAPNSFMIDYDKVKAAITSRTKAIIPVDIAGVMCQYDTLIDIASEASGIFNGKNSYSEQVGRIAIIADAAHSFGATSNGIKSGAAADFTCFSFHAVKNLTTGEGGAVTFSPTIGIDVDSIYKEYMLMSLHGQSKDALAKSSLGGWEYDILSPAFKCNMTDIMASIGIAQLGRYPAMLTLRQELINAYNTAFSGSIVEPMCHNGTNSTSSGHLYIARLTGKDSSYRNALIKRLAENGISANVHYKPLPMLTAYKNLGFNIVDFPNAVSMFENEITLPLHTGLTVSDVRYIAETLLGLL